jgi:hypothetical protein
MPQPGICLARTAREYLEAAPLPARRWSLPIPVDNRQALRCRPGEGRIKIILWHPPLSPRREMIALSVYPTPTLRRFFTAVFAASTAMAALAADWIKIRSANLELYPDASEREVADRAKVLNRCATFSCRPDSRTPDPSGNRSRNRRSADGDAALPSRRDDAPAPRRAGRRPQEYRDLRGQYRRLYCRPRPPADRRPRRIGPNRLRCAGATQRRARAFAP